MLIFYRNILGADLGNIHLISKFNKGIHFLLCVIDIYSKYTWGVLLKDEKGITITNAFQKILKESKLWVGKYGLKSWSEKNATEMYSTYNERKPDVAERFIRTLKNKFYKCMTSISKNVYIDKLGYIFYKYNNIYHSTTEMNPVDIKSSTNVDSSKEINDKDPKFKIGDVVRISEYKNIFCERPCSKLVWRRFYD